MTLALKDQDLSISDKIRKQALLDSKESQDESKPRDYFRASEAGDCRREISYKMLGYKPKEFEARVVMLLEDGNLHHDDLRKRISKIPDVDLSRVEEDISKDVDVDGVKIKVKGHPDGVINKTTVLEIKGISHFSFKELLRTRTPNPKYVKQSNLYMWLMDLNKGIILFKNKNNSEIFDIEIDYSPEITKEVLNKFASVWEFVKKGDLAERDYLYGSKECYLCKFFDLCWGSERHVSIAPKANHQRIGDLSVEEKEGSIFLRLASKYEEIREKILSLEEDQEEIKDDIKENLRKLKCDGVKIGKYRVLLTEVELSKPDKRVIDLLVSQGKIPYKITTYKRLSVENLEDKE